MNELDRELILCIGEGRASDECIRAMFEPREVTRVAAGEVGVATRSGSARLPGFSGSFSESSSPSEIDESRSFSF
jgi:hypothetical protein